MTSLERYIKKQDKIIQEDKEKTLIELGITEKEYSPDGLSTYLYSQFEYIDGQKRYYRIIASEITDEEYAMVLQKKALVDAIQEKEAKEKERKRTSKHANIAKTWVPVFAKPESTWSSFNEKAPPNTGKSKIATILRFIAVLSIIVCVIAAIFYVLEEPVIAAAIIACAFFENLLVFSLAEILDHLAEQTAIMREGLIYKETKK